MDCGLLQVLESVLARHPIRKSKLNKSLSVCNSTSYLIWLNETYGPDPLLRLMPYDWTGEGTSPIFLACFSDEWKW